jgi:uncharacterized membrane protein YjjP (DUF1212 family)
MWLWFRYRHRQFMSRLDTFWGGAFVTILIVLLGQYLVEKFALVRFLFATVLVIFAIIRRVVLGSL